jgi:hypothetical protein
MAGMSELGLASDCVCVSGTVASGDADDNLVTISMFRTSLTELDTLGGIPDDSLVSLSSFYP